MAREDFQRLLAQIDRDPELRSRVRHTADVDAFVELAASLGFAIDSRDVSTAEIELSDAELAALSGGVSRADLDAEFDGLGDIPPSGRRPDRSWPPPWIMG
ncbi:MAG TPA: Nif11-like leader peptide family RiPP precursor [Candidatus Nanopelagicales bacterium]|nr:Nif11-like leader peptide family RiPP precursor [Candidatus Nanopelagicales bacterium]